MNAAYRFAVIAFLAILGFGAAAIPTTTIYLLWCAWQYPHDGQVGLGVIMIAPIAGLVGAAVSGLFTADLLRKRDATLLRLHRESTSR
jgi:hypothetical protein